MVMGDTQDGNDQEKGILDENDYNQEQQPQPDDDKADGQYEAMLNQRPPFPGADPLPGQQPIDAIDDSNNDMGDMLQQ